MADEQRVWSFGLRNFQGKYLTAETFGYRINCNGPSMKKKQIFFLEQDSGSNKVYIRSTLNRYLSATAAGDFKGDSESKGPNEQFEIEAQKDGRWAIKTSHGYYAGGAGEDLRAYTKTIEPDRLWTVQLAMHPQVVVRNVNRKRYLHLVDNMLAFEESIPWGHDAMITLTFFDDGKYGLEASDGRFLSRDGSLKGAVDGSCKFTLEFYGGQLAFRSDSDAPTYLTAVGARGKAQASKPADAGVSRDELFIIEDSNPQIKMTAQNGRKVSIRSGTEVTANQDTAEDTETFQIELNGKNHQWAFRSCKDLLWCTGGDGAVAATSKDRTATCEFTVQWLGPKLALRSVANGKFVSIKKNGSLIANSDTVTDECQFVYELINRPKLVLRGEYGFLGTLPSGQLECTKATPEVFDMHVSKGFCKISKGGKYWKVTPTGVTVSGSEPELMTFEFLEPSKIAIKVGDNYLQGQQNGGFTATGKTIDSSTLWEF